MSDATPIPNYTPAVTEPGRILVVCENLAASYTPGQYFTIKIGGATYRCQCAQTDEERARAVRLNYEDDQK